jgi:hypothetical protein
MIEKDFSPEPECFQGPTLLRSNGAF